MNRARVFLIIAILSAGAMPLARAAPGTTCVVSSLSSLAFAYDSSLVAPTDSSASMTIQCSRSGGPPNITMTISAGASATSGSTSPRQMRGISSGDLLSYNIYRDAGRSQVFGQTAGVDTLSVPVSGIPNKGSTTVPINLWGRIPALQAVGIGSYTDSVVITVAP